MKRMVFAFSSRNQMKTVFFAWITEDFKDTVVDFKGFYKSFKHFHPDIDLKIYTDDDIAKVFGSEPWIMHSTCKAAFAKKLYEQYDLVVNVDADFYFFDRCHEILEADYDIAACSNYNAKMNVGIEKKTIDGYDIPYVSEIEYVQAGLVASTSKEFWDEYYNVTRDLGLKLRLYENDTLNILWHSGKYKTKLLDCDYDYRSTKFLRYYNCASLGRENTCSLVNGQVILDGKPMRSYHVAHGNPISAPGGRARKPRLDELFSPEIVNWFNKTIMKDDHASN